MPQGNPKAGEKYLHFKKKPYQIVAVGKHSETDEKMVVYQALYGDFGIYIRPFDMFTSEVDHEKYPEVTQKYRFQYMKELEVGLPEILTYTGTENSEKNGVSDKSARFDNGNAVPMVDTSDRLSQKQTAAYETETSKAEHKTLSDGVSLEESEKASADPDSEEQANPWLMKFLDAESFDEKYQIVSEMYADIDDKLIDDLAVCLDVVIPEGKLTDRYMELKHCIRTRQKYEGSRMV